MPKPSRDNSSGWKKELSRMWQEIGWGKKDCPLLKGEGGMDKEMEELVRFLKEKKGYSEEAVKEILEEIFRLSAKDCKKILQEHFPKP